MQMILMRRDWTLAEDANGYHVLTEGNTFPVSDDDAERAVDEDGAAEYVGTRPSKKVFLTDAPIESGDAAVSPAMSGTADGESSLNSAPVKGKAVKTGEDAPA